LASDVERSEIARAVKLAGLELSVDCEEMGTAGKRVETSAVEPLDKVTEGDRVTPGDVWPAPRRPAHA
jgi:hypothetical protein